MKRFSRILSSVMIVCLLVSCLAVTSFAAQNRTYKVVADKTEVKAGDAVVVELQVNELLGAWNAGYELYFDPAVFTLDTASGGRGKPAKYVDSTWYSEVTSNDGIIGWYWGTSITYNANLTEGFIKFAWAGNTGAGEGVAEADNMKDYAIGKFTFNVVDGAKVGDTTITVAGKTADFAGNADTMTYVPLTITVAGDEEEVVEPTFGATTDMGTDGVVAGDKKYDNALAVETTITAVATTTEVGIVFAPKAWLAGADLVADKAGVAKAAKTDNLGAGDITFTAAIKGIPRIFEGKDIVMVTVPYAFDGTNYAYGAAVETIVNFGNTGE